MRSRCVINTRVIYYAKGNVRKYAQEMAIYHLSLGGRKTFCHHAQNDQSAIPALLSSFSL
jgi:hypothetical protein